MRPPTSWFSLCLAVAVGSAGCESLRNLVGGPPSSKPGPASQAQATGTLPPVHEAPLGVELERVWDARVLGTCAPTLTAGAVLFGHQSQVIAEPDLSPQDSPGVVMALDRRTGAVLWQQRLKAWLSGCPSVADGVVAIADGEQTVYAFDAADGTQLWSARVAGLHGGVLAREGRVYAFSRKDGVVALDLRKGRKVWTAAVPGPPHGGSPLTPVSWGDVLYVQTSSYSEDPVKGSVETNTFHAYGLSDGKLKWQRALEVGFNAPLLYRFGSDVYLVSDRSALYTLDAATGAVRSIRPMGDPARARAEMLFEGGVLCHSDLDASTVRRFELSSGRELPPIAAPSTPRWLSVQNEHLLVLSDDGLHAHHLATAKESWQVKREQGVGPVAWSQDVLYFSGWALSLRAHSLQLELALAQRVFHVNGAIDLEASLTNRRPDGVLRLNTFQAPWNLARAVEIRDSAGRVLRLQEKSPPTAGVRSPDDYWPLAPGESWKTRFSLAVGPLPSVDGRLYVFEDGRPFQQNLPPGEYELEGVYENSEDSANTPDPVYGSVPVSVPSAWKGRVRSQPVKITIW